MGIDPGFAATGFAIATVEGRSPIIKSVLAIGLIESDVDATVRTKTEDRFLRAQLLQEQLRWVANEFQVDAIACEMPYLSVGRYTNFAHGILFGAIAALDLPTLLIWPAQLKSVARKSRKVAGRRSFASKKEVIAWAMAVSKPSRLAWPTSKVPNTLGLKYKKQQVVVYAEHPADALAAIQAGIRTTQWLTAPDRPPECAPRYEMN
jgi:Holliday junction resolvasome RuvABC endonuclease subunit